MPIFANGNRFDGDIARARGDNIEVTMAVPHDGVVRVLAYVNHARMGRYPVATAAGIARGVTPDIVADDAPGRVKYGFAVNGELPIADDDSSGVFGRLGWNDGRTESFAFTECDRHASLGVQVAGSRWRRSGDVLGIAAVADGLSPSHRAYLAAGGKGFLLGDGALRYGPESAIEAYYSLRFGAFMTLSPDVIVVVNPGYNRDRGPAAVLSVRAGFRR
jgi:carbohydrate-selective porin OprB